MYVNENHVNQLGQKGKFKPDPDSLEWMDQFIEDAAAEIEYPIGYRKPTVVTVKEKASEDPVMQAPAFKAAQRHESKGTLSVQAPAQETPNKESLCYLKTKSGLFKDYQMHIEG